MENQKNVYCGKVSRKDREGSKLFVLFVV